MRQLKILHQLLAAGEIDTVWGRAIVEERYSSLRRQIPVIYLLALVNLCGLELATKGKLTLGVNFPTLLCIFAVVRMAQWFRSTSEVSHEAMLRRLKQTCWLSAVLCISVCIWCLYLAKATGPAVRMPVILFGGLTAIGTAYGLSFLPSAARLPLLVLALPLAIEAALSSDPKFIGAALSLVVVALLILRLLSVHNSHFVDLTKSRATIARERQLAESARQDALRAATTDFLTGLHNRRAFVGATKKELEANPRQGGVAIAVVDLDRFKVINDIFGHACGDKLLKIVAKRLRKAVRGRALVARLGGDEFGLLFSDIAAPDAAQAIGSHILAEVNQPAMINGRKFPVSGCCGFGLALPGEQLTSSQILTQADLSLYQAKREGRGTVSVFEPQMEAPYRRRSQIERALQLPDFRDNVSVVYQPILDLGSGRLLANEALARWHDQELGEVPPAEFIPIAEQLNVIGNISGYLMSIAFAEASQWADPVRLSFNLSAVQLCSENSADVILEQLGEAGLVPQRLQVEVTETALLADFAKARENLNKLRAAGIGIVLDDFGAGYASIGYLREMRFDQVKLDGALVTAAQSSADGERLLGAVVGLCLALGVSPVAEHVENEDQVKLLLNLGCVAGQGHWLQPPMPAEVAREFSRSAGTANHGASSKSADPQHDGHSARLR